MVEFGSFESICRTISLTVCPLVGPLDHRTVPSCYSRNIDIVGFILFQPGTFTVYLVALIMTVIMIYNIRMKYTAVGRKEMVLFFYLYATTVLMEMLLITGIIPIGSSVYPWFTAAHMGLISTTIWSLLLNGFVGFQFAEDGTALSLWVSNLLDNVKMNKQLTCNEQSIRISSLFVWGGVFAVSILTFRQNLDSTNPLALWIIYIVLNGAAISIYFILQVILKFWVTKGFASFIVGDILIAGISFIAGQIALLGFSHEICEAVTHYLDGLFFAAGATLFSVMMIYKYWDSITKDDLEYLIDCKSDQWEVQNGTIEEEITQKKYREI
ncbi:Chitin synthase, class 7 [Basidiobolus ranarum]|uniref:Chitin synthase, class 7 n=1 Tax=Basidiobolus ranarum TaxID=34480 RepID=A0ABR2WT75_9FUNG